MHTLNLPTDKTNSGVKFILLVNFNHLRGLKKFNYATKYKLTYQITQYIYYICLIIINIPNILTNRKHLFNHIYLGKVVFNSYPLRCRSIRDRKALPYFRKRWTRKTHHIKRMLIYYLKKKWISYLFLHVFLSNYIFLNHFLSLKTQQFTKYYKRTNIYISTTANICLHHFRRLHVCPFGPNNKLQ